MYVHETNDKINYERTASIQWPIHLCPYLTQHYVDLLFVLSIHIIFTASTGFHDVCIARVHLSYICTYLLIDRHEQTHTRMECKRIRGIPITPYYGMNTNPCPTFATHSIYNIQQHINTRTFTTNICFTWCAGVDEFVRQ